MTAFLDGPAKGQNLLLKNAPLFLRVVEAFGKWDALDAPGDRPSPNETLYAYRLKERLGNVHLNCGRRGGSGFYTTASYEVCLDQPAQEQMRSESGWSEWCAAQGEK